MSKNTKKTKCQSHDECQKISPLIIPKVIRIVSCYATPLSSNVSPPRFSLDSEPEEPKVKKSYKKKIRVAKNSKEDTYLNRAIDFLTSIETSTNPESNNISSDETSSDSSTPDESYNQMSTSSTRKKRQKSYKHCLNYTEVSR